MLKVFFAVMTCLLAAQQSATAQTTTVSRAGKGSVTVADFRMYFARDYVAPEKNLALLRELKPKISSIRIADFTADDPDMKTLVYRMS